MIQNKEVTTVKEMVQAIVSGERPPKPQTYQVDETPTRFEEFYDMISLLEHVSSPLEKGQVLEGLDQEIKEAQANDVQCRALSDLVQGRPIQAGLPEKTVRALEWKAPYHVVSEDGILRRLCWRTTGKSEVKGLEGSTPAVIPAAEGKLRAKLCGLLHEESGHSGYLKTMQTGLERFIWTGMQADLLRFSKHCNQCNYYGDKRPGAPITGHVTADEPAQRIQMDAVHMTNVEDMQYMITLCDVFSRWGMAIPVKDLKSKTVVQALRRHAIPQGMGRPGEFLLDGGSEFAGFMKAACEAWGTKYRVHTPHHSQSAGIIERLNKTLELRIAHFSRQCDCTWLDALPMALEAYNGSVHLALSQGQVGISPAEVWLSRKLRFNSDVRARLHDRPTDVQAYVEWMKKQTAVVKQWISAAETDYREAMVKAKNNRATLRSLQVGDEVVMFTPTERKAKNAGTSQWDGPWEVQQFGEHPTDYLVRRAGSRKKPQWAHIDNLIRIQRAPEDIESKKEQEMPAGVQMKAAPNSSKNYDVEEVVGEKGTTRRNKHYLLRYKGYEGAWWQPAANLYCLDKIKSWDMLTPKQKAEKTAEQTAVNPEDVNLIMDLRANNQPQQGRLIRTVCERIGIKVCQIMAVLASPCCNTFSKVDAINQERGHHYREWKKPFPPRKFDGTKGSAEKGTMAAEHDAMVENLLQSILEDRDNGDTYDFVIENPTGLLRHRPYMNETAWLRASNRKSVDYCAFRHSFQKSTDLWHSFGEDWQPKGTTGDGKCHQACGAGRRKKNGRFSHWTKHASRAGEGVKGKDRLLQKWMIPDDLCTEVIRQLPEATPEKQYVIDLFSGGESYRRAVEAAGFIYVPVDIKTLDLRRSRLKVKEAMSQAKGATEENAESSVTQSDSSDSESV